MVAHHLFGIPSDVDRTARALRGERESSSSRTRRRRWASKSSGRKLGTLGDVGIFSLGRGKNITCGSGGVIVTQLAQPSRDAVGRQYRELPLAGAGPRR